MSYQYPTPLDLGSSAAEALGGTTHQPSGVKYVADGVGPDSSPSLSAQDNNRIRHAYDLLDTELRAVAVGALAIGVYPGRYRKSDGTAVLFEGEDSQALTDAATNYVYILHSSGALTVSTSSFPADVTTFTPIAVYVCSGGAIATPDWQADYRGLVRFWTLASVSAPTGTTATSFLLDNDNAGAGANCQLRAERGSSDAEDAALEWDEANDRWNVRKQHSTATYCPVNASELQISGTAMVDSNGAAKVQSAVAGDGLSHSAGVLAVGTDGATIETSSDVLRIKDAGVSAAKLSNALADKLCQISIGDSSGASPRTVTIQAQDIQGNNLAETVYVRVRVCQDADGAALATNATIAVGGTGTLVRSETATKDLVCKTDANGTLTITVTDGTLETVYLLAQPTTRSKIMDCSDIGTVTIA